jgi:hypothetical protein
VPDGHYRAMSRSPRIRSIRSRQSGSPGTAVAPAVAVRPPGRHGAGRDPGGPLDHVRRVLGEPHATPDPGVLAVEHEPESSTNQTGATAGAPVADAVASLPVRVPAARNSIDVARSIIAIRSACRVGRRLVASPRDPTRPVHR